MNLCRVFFQTLRFWLLSSKNLIFGTLMIIQMMISVITIWLSFLLPFRWWPPFHIFGLHSWEVLWFSWLFTSGAVSSRTHVSTSMVSFRWRLVTHFLFGNSKAWSFICTSLSPVWKESVLVMWKGIWYSWFLYFLKKGFDCGYFNSCLKPLWAYRNKRQNMLHLMRIRLSQ